MKNCPNCGTLIVDNKKICYYCGTDLSKTDDKIVKDDGFADNFFAQIVGAVPANQDNVENAAIGAVSDVSIEDVSKMGTEGQKSSDSFTSLVSLASEEPIQEEIINLNDFNTEVQNKTFNLDGFESTFVQESFVSNDKNNIDVPMVRAEEIVDIEMPKIEENLEQPRDSEEVVEQSAIKGVVMQPEIVEIEKPLQEKKEIKVNKSFIFNTCCFVIFIFIMIFVYFKFIYNSKNELLSLAGLTYKINEDFTLTGEDQGSRLYSYKNNGCDLRVTYGAASGDDYIDNWFNNIKETFKNNENYSFQNEKLTINENQWSTLTVMEMPNGKLKEPTLRYKYSTIVNMGNFYQIVFVNLNDDEKCLSMYNEFADTLKFQ